MKTKKIAIVMMSFLMLSGVLIATVSADSWPVLPSSPVTLVTYNDEWDFPFDVWLSSVPGGFDISNGMYTGWCVDTSHYIYSGVGYQVQLYSSLDPPASLSEPWDLINYILNHKDSGSAADIQDALWYIVDGVWSTWDGSHTPTATAEAIATDAITNGNGYTPGPGDILGIICLPEDPDGDGPEQRAQMLVIELTIPKVSRGKVTGGGQIKITQGKGSFGFNAMWFSRDPDPKGELEWVDHDTGMKVHAHLLDYLNVWDELVGNKPWPLKKAFFSGPCTVDHADGFNFEVYVEDNGEPGKKDYFGLWVYNNGDLIYEAGDTLLHGNVQIHKPPK